MSGSIVMLNRIAASAVLVATAALIARVILPTPDPLEGTAVEVRPMQQAGTQQADGAAAENAPAPDAARQSSAGDEVVKRFDFHSWAIGQSVELDANSSRSTPSLTVKLVQIRRSSADTITLVFNAIAGERKYYGEGNWSNDPENPRLLFVNGDAYITIGTTKSLYAEGMYLIDNAGNKYKAKGGIEGVPVSQYNSSAYRALVGWGKTTPFKISFPIPENGARSLRFVSPYLSGHQDEWTIPVYDADAL